jgi:hypothetical protein
MKAFNLDMDAFLRCVGRACEDSGTDKMHRAEQVFVQAMSMPHEPRRSCRNEYLLCAEAAA